MDPKSSAPPPADPGEVPRSSAPVRVARFVGRHPTGVVQGVFVVLIAIVVLQNVEPTSIDVLFWSVPGLPKLVLILVAMLAGGLIWEIARRLLSR